MGAPPTGREISPNGAASAAEVVLRIPERPATSNKERALSPGTDCADLAARHPIGVKVQGRVSALSYPGIVGDFGLRLYRVFNFATA